MDLRIYKRALSPDEIAAVLNTVNYKDVANKKITIFPNPATDELNIQFNEKIFKSITIDIIDSLGKVVLESKLDDKKSIIDINKLSNGAYIIKIKNEFGSSIGKFIKK